MDEHPFAGLHVRLAQEVKRALRPTNTAPASSNVMDGLRARNRSPPRTRTPRGRRTCRRARQHRIARRLRHTRSDASTVPARSTPIGWVETRSVTEWGGERSGASGRQHSSSARTRRAPRCGPASVSAPPGQPPPPEVQSRRDGGPHGCLTSSIWVRYYLAMRASIACCRTTISGMSVNNSPGTGLPFKL